MEVIKQIGKSGCATAHILGDGACFAAAVYHRAAWGASKHLPRCRHITSAQVCHCESGGVF